MDINKERAKLKAFYPGSRVWIMKVNKMSDLEVVAILKRLKMQGRKAA